MRAKGRFMALVGLVLSLFILTGCVKFSCPKPSQPGTFIDPEREDSRFLLVDEWYEYGVIGHCYVYADKVTGVMYLYTSDTYQATMTPLYNSDGTLMIYDEG